MTTLSITIISSIAGGISGIVTVFGIACAFEQYKVFKHWNRPEVRKERLKIKQEQRAVRRAAKSLKNTYKLKLDI